VLTSPPELHTFVLAPKIITTNKDYLTYRRGAFLDKQISTSKIKMFRKKYVPTKINVEVAVVNINVIYNPRIDHITKYHRIYELSYTGFLVFFVASYYMFIDSDVDEIYSN
jgi:hypothetical protein